MKLFQKPVAAAFFIAALLAPTCAFAYQYTGVRTDGDRTGNIIFASVMCERFGFQFSHSALQARISAQLDRYAASGLDLDVAWPQYREVMNARIAARRTEAETFQSQAPLERVRELGAKTASFRFDCDLITDLYPDVLISDGDEDQVTEAYMADMVRAIEDRVAGDIMRFTDWTFPVADIEPRIP